MLVSVIGRKCECVVESVVMSWWLSLSDAVLSMVVRCLSDTVAAQAFQISRLILKREDVGDVVEEAKMVRKAVEGCDCGHHKCTTRLNSTSILSLDESISHNMIGCLLW